MQRSVIREYIALISLRSIRLMLATRLDSHIIYRHPEAVRDRMRCRNYLKLGRNFHTILVVVAGLANSAQQVYQLRKRKSFSIVRLLDDCRNGA